MVLLGMFECDDYLPEFGTLVVRDAPGAGAWGEDQRDVGHYDRDFDQIAKVTGRLVRVLAVPVEAFHGQR